MPDDKQEVSQRISAHLAQGQNSQARAEMETLLRDWPGDPEVLTLAGDVYAWTGAPSTAYRHYNTAADTYNRQGKADKMLSVHHKILELDATLLDANTQIRIRLLGLLVGAEDALSAGRFDQAVTGYQEAIRQFPNHTVTYQRLATLYLRLGRPAEAVQQFLTVARAFYQHGVLPKAAPYFERILEIEADHAEALTAVITHYEKENRLADSERFIKSAVQSLLIKGDPESAGNWFVRLPESMQQDITPLRAALLLQSGDVEQAEDAVKMLDQDRPEIGDWFKRMGRAALDRGDSVNADIFFRWASPPAPTEAQVIAEVVSPVAAAAPQLVVAAPAPPPAPLPVPAPAAVTPVPVASVPVPPPVMAPVPPPPAPLPAALPVPPAPAPQSAPLEASVTSPKEEDERAVLQTMGEMCLAEEMYEEARQVFERLTKSDPSRQIYADLLNRARAGLGLASLLPSGIPAPPPPQRPFAPLPPSGPVTPLAAPSVQAASFRVPPPSPPAAPLVPQTLAPQETQYATATPMAAAGVPAPPSPPPPVGVPAPPQRSGPKIMTTPVMTPPTPPAAPRPSPALPPAQRVPEPVPAAPLAPPPPPVLPQERPQIPPIAPEFMVPQAATASPPPPVQRPQLDPIAIRKSGEVRPESTLAPQPTLEWERPAPPYAAPKLAAAAPAPVMPSAPIAPPPPPRPRPVPTPVLAPALEEKKVPVLIGATAAITSDGSKIVPTAHRLELGELPPSTPSNLDFDDDIIE